MIKPTQSNRKREALRGFLRKPLIIPEELRGGE